MAGTILGIYGSPKLVVANLTLSLTLALYVPRPLALYVPRALALVLYT